QRNFVRSRGSETELGMEEALRKAGFYIVTGRRVVATRRPAGLRRRRGMVAEGRRRILLAQYLRLTSVEWDDADDEPRPPSHRRSTVPRGRSRSPSRRCPRS